MTTVRPEICFEDLVLGTVSVYGDRTVGRDEIIAFARQFDPQPYHLDETLAKATFAGSLIASGWHTNALMNRLNCEHFLNRSSCMGSPGLDEVRWIRPVRPGDRLTVRRSIVASRSWRSRPDRGTVQFLYELINQHGEITVRHDCRVIFGRREPARPDAIAAEGPAMPAAARGTDPAEDAAHPRLIGVPFFDDLPLDHISDLGTYAFTDENVREFALAFDNQGFHLDADVARRGPFGGIIASGWHTGAAWMGRLIRDRQARMQAAEAQGAPVAQLGVSPGLRNLRWLKPVRPGDVLTFRSRVLEKRASASRPGWGLVFSQNTADNQAGDRVFEFTGSVFWERRQP